MSFVKVTDRATGRAAARGAAAPTAWLTSSSTPNETKGPFIILDTAGALQEPTQYIAANA